MSSRLALIRRYLIIQKNSLKSIIFFSVRRQLMNPFGFLKWSRCETGDRIGNVILTLFSFPQRPHVAGDYRETFSACLSFIYHSASLSLDEEMETVLVISPLLNVKSSIKFYLSKKSYKQSKTLYTQHMHSFSFSVS